MGALPAGAKHMEAHEKKSYTLQTEPKRVEALQRLHDRMGAENLADALFKAVDMLNELYDYQEDNYALFVQKGDKKIPLHLPTPSHQV